MLKSENQNANMANNKQEEFVLSLDVGTTNIRAFIYDQTGAIRGHDNDKVSAKLIFFLKLHMYTQVKVLTYVITELPTFVEKKSKQTDLNDTPERMSLLIKDLSYSNLRFDQAMIQVMVNLRFYSKVLTFVTHHFLPQYISSVYSAII